MTLPPLRELALFMALVLVLSLYGLTVSGHFPAEHRAATLRTGVGRLLLWGTIILCAALALSTLVLAWRRVPIYAAVIGDPRATAEHKAYALFRAINCYAPSGANGCGGADVPESQRQAWFRRLKGEFGGSRWARELRYYW